MNGHSRSSLFRIVVIKLTAPSIEEAPAKCNAKIAMSTEGPACPSLFESGGYIVTSSSSAYCC